MKSPTVRDATPIRTIFDLMQYDLLSEKLENEQPDESLKTMWYFWSDIMSLSGSTSLNLKTEDIGQSLSCKSMSFTFHSTESDTLHKNFLVTVLIPAINPHCLLGIFILKNIDCSFLNVAKDRSRALTLKSSYNT